MTDKQTIEDKISKLTKALNDAQAELEAWTAHPLNNIYESLDAATALKAILLARACQDCEGSYNCGADFYEQAFMVGDQLYVARLDCEYNRHDKTYYYVDGTEFSIRKVDEGALELGK